MTLSHLSFPLPASDGAAPVRLALQRGDVLLLRGVSGCGKTTLLRRIAGLEPWTRGGGGDDDEQGAVLRGQPASAAPAAYRARVSLVAQRPPRLPGAPAALWASILAFGANADVRSADADETVPLLVPQPAVASGDASFGERQAPGWRLSDVPCAAPAAPVAPTRLPADPEALLARWGAPPRIFHADWSTLSGGEAARASLAISLALQLRRGGDGVLLLDEPTAALDLHTAQLLEADLLASEPRLTLLWVTHADAQAVRIAASVRSQAGRRVGLLQLGEQ
ncbi:P-loop containing nucleoside triphosphate hydrolase protein [Tilletiopsis washingtonensis]|uniref:P-loop containing nucleoside triphosphate hydrolase protein n=1 Tax=Tilletiopsis washingtonensis TaxID=58919 RepID=A0A316Z194_9BASI|nr:P-loop containing nucleoside triphosphate hydrolase protein [Tilletiopsis washingtonensis]PWN95550.1 P-loop containing nucleoside triphosphate hydrolase protein [Tilletiopsis washingtonensis]